MSAPAFLESWPPAPAAPKIYRFVHLAGGDLEQAVGEPVKANLKLGLMVDLTNPEDVRLTYMGGPSDEYFLNFIASMCPGEIDKWTEFLTHFLFELGTLSATQKLIVSAGKWRFGGWTGVPLNKPMENPPEKGN